jgi:hypothetical protein
MPTDRRPFLLLHLLPDSLHDVILDFHWDLERLWRLDLPVTELPVAAIERHLRLPLWSFEDQPFAVSPADVAADPIRFHKQYARTMAADLSYPIHLLNRRPHPTVLDGVHRLHKASLLGHRTVKVKLLPIDRLSEIAMPRSPA